MSNKILLNKRKFSEDIHFKQTKKQIAIANNRHKKYRNEKKSGHKKSIKCHQVLNKLMSKLELI